MLTAPIGITNTHSVGVVRDAIIAARGRELTRSGRRTGRCPSSARRTTACSTTSTASTSRADHVDAALAAAAGGPVAEGDVGGGTGMVCHEFKGGIGTASRVVDASVGGYTVGVLVQANYGRRDWLRVDGVPVGEAIPVEDVPSPYAADDDERDRRAGRRIRLDHRGRRDRRPAPPPPVRAARPAGRARDRPDGRHRRALERRPVPVFATGNRAAGLVPGPDPRVTVRLRSGPPATSRSGRCSTRDRGDRGGDRQRPRRRRDDGRPRRDHGHALPHDRLLEVMAIHGR